MKRIISLVLVGLLVLGMSSVVFGYGRAGMRGHMMSQSEYNNDYLDLSNEQLEEMRALEDEYYQQTRELNDQLRRKRDDLRYLYSQSDASQDELAQLQNEISILREELRSLQDEYQLAKRDILSAEQLERMNGTGFDCHGTRSSFDGRRSRGHGMMRGW
ncbi:periplasmic heavy metal sensor [Natroniella sulfidigena]|uniref:Spy/CpxP family protein refolding chaperone n=1 Tax=Natroniella sulfidigena TaxID=723921 RepID=UPI00200A6422|nr:periplasmic heavy metal sensor [Natroniella sulfidigena]MCK8817556.1 periplasmic heavy metal sensor [Natroniella sulfidigena]